MKKKTFFLFVIFLFAFESFVSAEVKTFIKEYTYQASEDDSRNSSRVTAMREVKRLLLEELGTYLESVTEVKNFQLTKDQITALTAGIVKTEIVSEKWDGHTYWIKTKIGADEGEVIKSIDSLRKDRDKSRELDGMKKRSDEILEENKKLREELKLAKGEDKQRQQRKYNNSIKELSAIEWFESGHRYFFKSGDYKMAAHDFNKAIELDPKNPGFYFIRGVTSERLGKYNEAIVDYNKSLELDPKASMVYFNRGVAYGKLGKYSIAIADFNKVIKLNHKYDEKAYYNRGVSYLAIDKYNEAIVDFNKVIELNPKYADAYLSRGTAYFKLVKYGDAIVDFNKAIELDPKNAKAYYVRSCIHSVLGHKESAIRDLTKAIQIDPNFQNVAKIDRAFSKLRKNPDFVKLIDK